MKLNDLLKIIDEYSCYDVRLRYYSVGSNKYYDLGYSKSGKNDIEIRRIIDGIASYDMCCYVTEEGFKSWYAEYKDQGYKMRELI